MDSNRSNEQGELRSQLAIAAGRRSSEDQTLWTSFYTFLAANAVLLVALFPTGEFPKKPQVTFVIAGAGAVMSLLWCAIQRRALGHIAYHDDLIRVIENQLEVPSKFAISGKINRQLSDAHLGHALSVRKLMTAGGILAAVGWVACLFLVLVAPSAVTATPASERNAAMELVLGLLGGFVLGIAASFIAWIVSENWARPLLKIEVDQNRAQGQLANNPPHEFYHVRVTNLPARRPVPGRRPAWACQATLEVVADDGKFTVLGPIAARWTSLPEPILAVGLPGGIVQVPDVAKMLTARRIDVHNHEEQVLAVALKFEGDDDCFLFTNESYAFPRCSRPEWRLPRGRHRVRIALHYDRGREVTDFWLENNGPRRDDVRLRPIV